MQNNSSNCPNIILIGFMGSGKSSVGRALSVLLNRSFVDLDEYALKSSGAPSINSLFAYLGEKEFRVLEKKNLEEILKNRHQIIATGGGTLVSESDLEYSLDDSIVVYLETDFEVCKNRASRSNRRPLFKDPIKAQELFTHRKPLYERLATISVRSEGSSAKVVANEILKLLEANNYA